MSDKGVIKQIIGAVIDVEFNKDQIPNIYDALVVNENNLVLETQQQLGDGVVRTVAMGGQIFVANFGEPSCVFGRRFLSSKFAVSQKAILFHFWSRALSISHPDIIRLTHETKNAAVNLSSSIQHALSITRCKCFKMIPILNSRGKLTWFRFWSPFLATNKIPICQNLDEHYLASL